MRVKRESRSFRNGDLIEVRESYLCRHGAPGCKREKKKEATPEQVQRQNQYNKERICRYKLLMYFDRGDCFATWTYSKDKRPESMEEAKKDFQKAIRKVKREYDKRGRTLRWIKNIEKGTKGAWHIHLVLNEIGDTATILRNAWDKGGMYVEKIQTTYGSDFRKLAKYIAKSSVSREIKKDGEKAASRVAESAYSTSKNMPLPEPRRKILRRWTKQPRKRKGYLIVDSREYQNPVTGYTHREYLMVRITRSEEYKYLC